MRIRNRHKERMIKKRMLDIAYKSKSSHVHIGSCLSCIDIITSVYLYKMSGKDRFILSKGHAALSLYAVINGIGRIKDREMDQYMQDGSEFAIHTPGSRPKDIPLATGSLGHGLSFAAGVAKGYQLASKKERVFCLISDGECNEGAVWEAALFAAHHRLDNLYVLIDKNGFQAFGRTKEVLGDAASAAKWKAFGFNVLECNGHKIEDIDKKLSRQKKVRGKPHVLICNTIRGKGIAAIENKLESNYVAVEEKIMKGI